MNKTAVKNYAVWARNELIERVSRKAFEYGIQKDNILDENLDNINGKLLNEETKKQRKELIKEIKDKGFDQVIEEVAYTWFNRFIALRFMEVNNYLPNRVRIFTNLNNEFKPQIIDEAMNIELVGLDKEYVFELIETNNRNELYKQLLLATCNNMGNYLPGMFTKISDYKVLLFPDNLLNQDNVLGKLISDIDEDSWIDTPLDNESSNGITIIGWMYQYYISEKHDQVINILKGTVKKEDIPAATQLWTTDWVVRYMVDNSLGRYWIERNPDSSLKNKLEYLATSKTGELPYIDEKVNPEDITFLDPCMGSGHILVYAFDVLMEIYKECGYSERDAALNIVQNNLYGLDIDDRAYQLSYFAVMMKARSYNRRALTSGILNNLASIQESNTIYSFAYEGITNDNELNQVGEYLVNMFKDAKEIGSLVTVKKDNYKDFSAYLYSLEQRGITDLFAIEWYEHTLPLMKQLSKQASILSNKYTICTTNPPYMGKMEGKLKQFVTKNYKDYSFDLFAVFMRRNFDFTINGGYLGFMTPFVWMFIKSYEKMREYIIYNKGIATLVQMEYSAYEEATVPICSFVLKNEKNDKPGYYYRLSDFKGGMEVQRQKVLEAQSIKTCGYFYVTCQSKFLEIPGKRIGYWLTNKLTKQFTKPSISSYADTRRGLQTGNSPRFIRKWFEVASNNSYLDLKNQVYEKKTKWVLLNSGGPFRKWYGNIIDVVNWKNNGAEIKSTGRAIIPSENRYFDELVSWNKISSGRMSVRYQPNGIIPGDASPFLHSSSNNHKIILYAMAILNSKVCSKIVEVLSPTLNFEVGNIAEIPFAISDENKNHVLDLTEQCVKLSKKDWDSFEISWSFTRHPLIPNIDDMCEIVDEKFTNKHSRISEFYENWEDLCNNRFNQLKSNEEELNRIFINIYGLDEELTPEVEDEDITVRKADLVREIKSLISYAVGCMFGRYSLDIDGLVYAGGNWDSSKYITFIPDTDNIIPICDDEYFDDDIVGRFVKFVEVVYGKETIEENLSFIAGALGGKGTSREVIRNYFLNDFFKDHCKIYQKRPIYWLFDSGKKNGFKALIYLHRYQPDLIARMRTQYVFEQQSRYRNQISMIENQLSVDISSSERVQLNKKSKAFKDQDEELKKYEEVVHHYADQMIPIDLDDGVKVNYDKFKELLAKIK